MTAHISDIYKLRPRRDWVLVLCDQRKTQLSSGLFLPDQETKAERVTEWSGLVIRLGPSEKLESIGVKEGDRIAYRGFMKNHVPIEDDGKWPDGAVKQYFMMDTADILAVIDDNTEVGIYSGRPMVPELS